MKIKQYTALAAALIVTISAFTACSSGSSSSSSSSSTSDSQSTSQSVSDSQEQSSEFVLKYPEDMQKAGFTQEIKLDETPKNIVCMSTYPVMTLYEIEVEMTAVPTTKVLDYPEDLTAERLPSMMSDQFDIESVVALEPDLVMMAPSNKDTHGATLESLGIPVYYVAISSQTGIPLYQVIKNQTNALIDAFAKDEASRAAGEAIMKRFDDAEAHLSSMKSSSEGKKVMILTTSDPSTHSMQNKNGTIGSMFDLMGFENVYNGEAGSVPLDMETALEYQPDLVVFTGGMEQKGMEELIEKTISQNPDYWNAMDAIKNKEYICLPSNYVSTAGINIINNMNDLADIIETHYAQ